MNNIISLVAGVVLGGVLVILGVNFSAPSDQLGMGVINPEVFHSSIAYKEPVVNLAKTNIYSTTTLSAVDSGTNYYLTGSGTTMTLPAVGHAGTHFRFVVGGALDTGNVIIDSAEGDNIDGTLIVAGAVVDCRGEDQINFVVDGEQVGDYVEVRSNGTQWVIGDSGVLTAAKMTCTDPS